MKMTNILLKKAYYILIKIRKFEEKISELYPQKEMKCPTHLHTGEEAIATGVCLNLKKGDYVFSTHRNHSHYIAKGGDIRTLAAEIYGKRTGCCKGKGGSMHTTSDEINFYTSAIVGGTLPLACGAALAQTLKGSRDVVVSFFGDGAVDTGTFYESLNFAFLKKLPLVFICENNFYATHSHFLARQPKDSINKRTYPFGAPGARIDGNNVLEVFAKAKTAIDNARRGKGPSLIECRTYRWMGHVMPHFDHKLGYRSKQELDAWLKRCPVKKFKKFLSEKSSISAKEIGRIDKQVGREIDKAFHFAKISPYPKTSELTMGL
ncbi:MAG: thiamine pyrophosphate-dependent dehydrogenase E1 component subunit alpha [Candidatus Omnitrophota bacterium]